MNLYRLAVIALRVFGINWIISGLEWLLYTPRVILELLGAHPGTNHWTQLEISLAMHLIHAMFEVSAGANLIVRSKPLARFLVRLLGGETAAVDLLPNVWPPAPRMIFAAQLSLGGDDAERMRHVAAILFGVEGIDWLLSSVRDLSDLPENIFILMHRLTGYWTSYYVLDTSIVTMRLLIQLSAGLYFLFRSEALSNRITLDLVHDAEAEREISVTPPESTGNTEANVTH